MVTSGPKRRYYASGCYRVVTSTGRCNIYTLALEREMLKMKQRPRIYYSSEQRNLMWDRWQKGDSMHAIARLLIEAIHRFSGSCRILVGYVHYSEVDQDWRLRCRNEKRYRVVLYQDSRSDR